MKNILLCWWTGYFNFPYKLYAYIYFITCNAYKVYYDGTLLKVYFIDKTCLKNCSSIKREESKEQQQTQEEKNKVVVV